MMDRSSLLSTRSKRDDPPSGTLGSILSSHRDIGQGMCDVESDPDVSFTATLGSCVAVMLFDQDRKIGGMTHIFQCVHPGPLGGAAVVAEIERLVNAMLQRRATRASMVALLAGGAKTLGRGRDFGREIAKVCESYLETESIEVMKRDLGGKSARRIRFTPATAFLRVQHLDEVVADAPPVELPENDELELFIKDRTRS